MEIDSTQSPSIRSIRLIYSFILRTILDSIIIQYVASVSNKVKTEIDCMQSNRESGCVAATAFLNAFCSCSIAVYVTPS